MVILQFDKGTTSLMKVIALTILLLMLALVSFASALSRKKLRVEMLFDEPPMEDEPVDQEEVWSAIRYLDPDEQDSIADGALQCVAQLVGGAHIGNERKSGG
jgi:hypothetical protein